MSKLYTEEQVRFMLSQARFQDYNDWHLYSDDAIIEEQTPIELPTLEDIELKSVEYSTNTETKEFYKDCCWDFQNGAKWMRDKIKGGEQ